MKITLKAERVTSKLNYLFLSTYKLWHTWAKSEQCEFMKALLAHFLKLQATA